MALPSIEQKGVDLNGVTVQCSHIVCPEPANFRMEDVLTVPSVDDVVDGETVLSGGYFTWQTVAKSSEPKTIVVLVGNVEATFSLETGWKRYIQVYKEVDTTVSQDVNIFFPAGEYWLYHTMLEKGNRVSDWSASPQDTEEQLAQIYVEIREQYTQIMSDTEQIILEAVSNYVKISDFETFKTENTAAIQVKADEILSTVSETYTTQETTESMQSVISQQAEQIESKVSQTDYNGNTIASLINQSADSVKIQANHIVLSGDVVLKSNLIDGTTQISGNNIKTGTIDASQVTVANIDASKITTGQIQAGQINVSSISIDSAQIATGVINQARIPELSADKITSGTLDASVVTVNKLNASNITTGTLNASRIPNLSADKITTGTLNGQNVTITNLNASNITAGTINASRIPNISADKITTGTLNGQNVSVTNLNASSITAGTLNANRIPNISAEKITTGKLSSERIDVDTLHVKAANIDGTITADSVSANNITAGTISAAVTASNLTMTGGSIDISTSNDSFDFISLNAASGSNKVTVDMYPLGLDLYSKSGSYITTAEYRAGGIILRNSDNNAFFTGSSFGFQDTSGNDVVRISGSAGSANFKSLEINGTQTINSSRGGFFTSLKISGTTVIDSSRNASFNSLSVGGESIGEIVAGILQPVDTKSLSISVTGATVTANYAKFGNLCVINFKFTKSQTGTISTSTSLRNINVPSYGYEAYCGLAGYDSSGESVGGYLFLNNSGSLSIRISKSTNATAYLYGVMVYSL